MSARRRETLEEMRAAYLSQEASHLMGWSARKASRWGEYVAEHACMVPDATAHLRHPEDSDRQTREFFAAAEAWADR